MALRKMVLATSQTYNLEPGWIDMPNNVDPKTIFNDWKATNPPEWPPTTYDGALAAQQAFALYCHNVKGYTVYSEVTLVFK